MQIALLKMPKYWIATWFMTKHICLLSKQCGICLCFSSQTVLRWEIDTPKWGQADAGWYPASAWPHLGGYYLSPESYFWRNKHIWMCPNVFVDLSKCSCICPNVFVYLSKCCCVFVQMFLCICPSCRSIGISYWFFGTRRNRWGPKWRPSGDSTREFLATCVKNRASIAVV